jgi:hypothetical protein
MVGTLDEARRIYAPATRAGDITVTWDPESPETVDVARQVFERAMSQDLADGPSRAAYKLDAKGTVGARVHTFDPFAMELVVIAPIAGG